MSSFADIATQVIKGLGGAENIKDLEPCVTRLRVELHDAKKLDEATLRSAGAHGVMKMGTVVQVVMGTQSDNIEQAMREQMG